MAYKRTPLSFRLSTALHEKIQARAAQLDMDLSEYLRQILADDTDSVIVDPGFNVSRTIRLPRSLARRLIREAAKKSTTIAHLVREYLEHIDK